MSVPDELRARVLDLPGVDRAELAHERLLRLDPGDREKDPDDDPSGRLS